MHFGSGGSGAPLHTVQLYYLPLYLYIVHYNAHLPLHTLVQLCTVK